MFNSKIYDYAYNMSKYLGEKMYMFGFKTEKLNIKNI